MTYPDTQRLLALNAPLIGDTWLDQPSAGQRPHIDPNTGHEVGSVKLAGAAEVDQAVRVARQAQKTWQVMPGAQRRAALQRWLELIKAAEHDLTLMAALESGVTRTASAAPLAHAWIDYYAGWADRIEGSSSEGYPSGGFNFTRREPFGVIGVIIPWNSPLVAIAMTCSPALAAGNAVILKPPSNTPFVALKLGQLALEAGLPAGLLCVLPGDAEAGQALVAHPDVAKVCFTGGGEVARHVLSAAATTLKPVFLELGGKSPNLLFDDANLDTALPYSLISCMTLAGQGCVLPTRLLVQKGVYAEVLERLTELLPQLTVGAAYDPASVIGPIISEASLQRILGVIHNAQAQGQGRLLTGGQSLPGDGYFLEPTIFADVHPDAPLAREEIFGPVLTVVPFDSEEQALRIANDSYYGLGAYIQTRDLDRALRVAQHLEAGYVTINSFPTMNPNAPFGGYKRSGFGRLGGREGLDEYLQTKNIFIGLPPT